MANTLKFGAGQWATKVGSTLAYNSENGNFKPLPFNFTRATSATRVNKDGLIEVVTNNKPRVDFKDDANGALLLEPERRNLVAYSEDFSQSYWTKIEASVTSGFTSPNGATNAFKLVENTNNAAHIVFASPSITLGNNIFSVFAKAAERRVLGIEFPTNGILVSFDLIDGVFVNSQANPDGFSITPYANGWYRIDIQENLTSTSVVALSLRDDNGIREYQGDGTSGIYIWGAQLETGSYATSYIPTQGSTVTRVAEVCNGAGNEQVFNDSEGTLYIEANLIDGYDNNNFLATIFDNSNGVNNNIFIQRYLGNIQGKIVVGGTTQAEITESNTTSGNKKIAFTYKANEFKMFVNGSQVGLTDTSGSVFSPNTLDKINVGSYYNSTLNFNNGVKDVRVYDKALTDAELKALTS